MVISEPATAMYEIAIKQQNSQTVRSQEKHTYNAHSLISFVAMKSGDQSLRPYSSLGHACTCFSWTSMQRSCQSHSRLLIIVMQNFVKTTLPALKGHT